MAASSALDIISQDTVRSLFVTLRRGSAGKSWRQRRIIDALGLKVLHHCVEKPNNASIRGMLAKVSHLVIVETDKMFYLRAMQQYHHQLPKPVITVNHAAAVSAHLEQQAKDAQLRQQQEQQRQEQQQKQGMLATSKAMQKQQVNDSSSTCTRPLSLREQLQAIGIKEELFPIKEHSKLPRGHIPSLHPSQSSLVIPHLQEHLAPLPQGAQTSYQPPSQPPPGKRVQELLQKRAKLVHQRGLYHPLVAEINAQIQAARRDQELQETLQRQAALTAQYTPGPGQKRVKPFAGGTRRGALP